MAGGKRRGVPLKDLPFGRAAIWLLGILLVLAAVYYIASAANGKTLEIHQGVVGLLLAGVALVVCVELLPLLASLKVGDLELQFRNLGEPITNDVDALNGRLNALEIKVKALEEAAAGPAPATKARAKGAEDANAVVPPPELDVKGSVPRDQRKGVFGRKPEADGLRLAASFPGPKDAKWARIALLVEAADATGDMTGVDRVVFYLHETFRKDRVVAPVKSGVATLEVTAWGGFTVGAWVPNGKGPDGKGTRLELDLSELDYAPRVIREL